MSLILINKDDIAVGEPLQYALYDQDHNLLLSKGSIVHDQDHLNRLMKSGTYCELSWETPRDENKNTPSSAEAGVDHAAPVEHHTHFTFNDMNLKVEDRLQLQPPEYMARERFPVKVIGFIRGVSLLVTTPVADDGSHLQLMEGEIVVMRAFLGQNAFGFACTVMRTCKTPFEYLHLSFPDVIEGILIRKAPRVRTHIIASVRNNNAGNINETISARISNISANGAALDARQQLGNKGDILNISFRLNLHNVDALLSVKGRICIVHANDTANASNSDFTHHGIEFQDLEPNDSVILQSMIYQNMIEHPHQLI